MADLDTRSKRASSVQVMAPYILSPVLPDGTLSQGDRQHIAWTYSGILAAGAAEGQPYTKRIGGIPFMRGDWGFTRRW